MDWNFEYFHAFELENRKVSHAFELKDKKVSKEDIRRALNYLRSWLREEWMYFNLAKHLKKASGVTIHPLNIVKKSPSVAERLGGRIEIYPKKFDCRFRGNPVVFECFFATCSHEAFHMPQPLIDHYIHNESTILLVAEALNSPKKMKKYIENLTKLRMKKSQISFLEVLPCMVMFYLIFVEGSECSLYDKNTAIKLAYKFGMEMKNSDVHWEGLAKFVKLSEVDKELSSIFAHLSHFKILNVEDAEKVARSLRKEGYTYQDLPKLFEEERKKYSEKLKEFKKKIQNWRGRKIVEKRVRLFERMWKDSLNAKDLKQYWGKLRKYLSFNIIKDGNRYLVFAPRADPANVEIIVTYLSDAMIAKMLVESADSKDFDPEKVIKGSCIWRRNSKQFDCHDKDECEHESRWLDLCTSIF